MLDDLLQGRDLDSLTDDEKMAVLVKAGLMTSDSPAAAAAPAPQQAAADDEDPPRTEAERLAYLRSRGVEVELAEERQSHPPLPAAGGAGRAFTFVRIPAEPTVAVSLESAAAPSGGGDALPGLLAPRFADDGVMDDATVARETAGRLRNMVAGGAPGAAEALRAPSAETVRGAWKLGGPCARSGTRRGRVDSAVLEPSPAAHSYSPPWCLPRPASSARLERQRRVTRR